MPDNTINGLTNIFEAAIASYVKALATQIPSSERQRLEGTVFIFALGFLLVGVLLLSCCVATTMVVS
jgi:hypothetical protein